jgi:hypothetical protein
MRTIKWAQYCIAYPDGSDGHLVREYFPIQGDILEYVKRRIDDPSQQQMRSDPNRKHGLVFKEGTVFYNSEFDDSLEFRGNDLNCAKVLRDLFLPN